MEHDPSAQRSARERIEGYRADIDEVDRKLVALLNERAGYSLAIRALKPQAGMELYNPAREQCIFDKVCNLSNGTLYDQGLCEIYATLLKVMKENPSA